ncbi:MAG TPA: KEOPS complex subunit Pcc1 [Candidatus Thermoplasmatota archaeon]|nr:KEOPS complex subunit Pcc1 [Candidatus Thermoplasmatota archaeon]
MTPAGLHGARLTIPCGDPAVALAVGQALSLELAEGPEGTRADSRAAGPDLEVELQAADLSSLRAAIQSTLRLAEAARQAAS